MVHSKEIFVLIRYSILSKKPASWVIGRDTDFEDYKNKLFENKRLNYHHTIFKKMTLPSIASAISSATANTEVKAKCIVLTSIDLPEAHKKNLYDACQKYSWAEIHEIGSDKIPDEVFEEIVSQQLKEQEVIYATIRLDDDDAIATNFMQYVSGYMTKNFCGFALSLSKGFKAFFNQGKITAFEEVVTPKIAQGLCYIDYHTKETQLAKTIYSIGNHTKVDQKVPVISDARKHAFIWAIHEESDLTQKDKSRLKSKNDETLKSKVEKSFQLDNSLIQ